MARLDMMKTGTDMIAVLGPAAGIGASSGTDAMFQLGMMYASGRTVPVDLISAHQWFNIAAMRGDARAAGLRREIAAEMTDAEIGCAQRAARDWLRAHSDSHADSHADFHADFHADTRRARPAVQVSAAV